MRRTISIFTVLGSFEKGLAEPFVLFGFPNNRLDMRPLFFLFALRSQAVSLAFVLYRMGVGCAVSFQCRRFHGAGLASGTVAVHCLIHPVCLEITVCRLVPTCFLGCLITKVELISTAENLADSKESGRSEIFASR